MSLNIISIVTLVIVISVWLVRTTLKEGNGALKVSQTKK